MFAALIGHAVFVFHDRSLRFTFLRIQKIH
jgi:hypothetical protein